MLQKLRQYISHLSMIPAMRREVSEAKRDLAYVRESLGRIENRQSGSTRGHRLADFEFRVFSQWGEDGIIQFLIRNLPNIDKSFIEFGVESYQEANTRFLLMHDNWRGMIIDAGTENIAGVKASELYWRYNLTAVEAFITPSTINDLFTKNGFSGEIGLLSVDIDGMDYWVWKNISVVRPAIVVAEYNARFGPDRSVTLPLDEKFWRTSAHYSNIYYGVSLAALVKLGAEKNYSLVGCNSNGNNAFFVRNDLMLPDWRAMTSGEAFVPCQFRETRNEKGELTFLNADQETALLNTLPLVEV